MKVEWQIKQKQRYPIAKLAKKVKVLLSLADY